LPPPRSLETADEAFYGEVYVLSKDEGGASHPFFSGLQAAVSFFRTTSVTGRV